MIRIKETVSFNVRVHVRTVAELEEHDAVHPINFRMMFPEKGTYVDELSSDFRSSNLLCCLEVAVQCQVNYRVIALLVRYFTGHSKGN